MRRRHSDGCDCMDVLEADAAARSWLAWLYSTQRSEATDHVNRGLDRDPTNEHCQRLAERLAYPRNIGKV
jgi:hypothetical protein